MSGIIEGILLALLRYFWPKIYECVHTPSTIEQVHTDPKQAAKYASDFKAWKAKKDAQSK